ncbi:MAG: hypothetical protein ACOWWR_15490 [Eubacteriales bacterium]
MNEKDLCLNLAYADDEIQVIDILTKEGYWDDSRFWHCYGDSENNYATIGNQQSKPEVAIVEKIINSVDAVLMSECLSRGIDPEGSKAPKSIIEALQLYFDIPSGKLSNLSPSQRKIIADRISFIATGSKSNPSYTIIDTGEGQLPEKMPYTILSIGKSNKLRIPFVQGKFNMGGTGVFEFCGNKNIQLVISKRNPKILNNEKKNPNTSFWGFSIVRRDNPSDGTRSSCYRYLCPNGNILSFDCPELPLLPGDYPNAYQKGLKWGTFIKLYEYQMTGLKTNILFDLYNRLSLLMPTIALPVRLYERRKGYTGHTMETTLSGLTVRLDEDKKENLEDGFPTSSTITVNGQKMRVSIFVFKKEQASKYTKNEGIVFSVNGQTHGYLLKTFFSRKSVGMNYIADSLLVLLDCSDFDGRSREVLFMNSRDRLREGEFRNQIENVLEELIKNHPGLRELKNKRRAEDIENKLDDSKPLADVVEKIIKTSPTLAQIFIQGIKIQNPFKVKNTGGPTKFTGKKFPTYFSMVKEYSEQTPKSCPINSRFRLQFKTDAVNDYFDRDRDPGTFNLAIDGKDINDLLLNLWQGIANLTVTLPENVKVGQILHFHSSIIDINRALPFEHDFFVVVEDKKDNVVGGGGKGNRNINKNEGDTGEQLSNLALPNIIEVYEDHWGKHNFSKESALKVIDSGENGYDFYINMDNVHLQTEKKPNVDLDVKILDARYKYGMVLIGIAMLQESNNNVVLNNKLDEDNDKDVFKNIAETTKIISPILLPMINGLGSLQTDEVISESYGE